jgi:putative nucleotidyltransferase with HDIG domain
MIELLKWFQRTYPELKTALLECHHNFDDNDTNPYHVEGDCWSHTMLVCKIAQLKGYDSVVQVAALLHDIGKPQSRRVNPKNNHVQFFGHEALSATMAKPLVADLVENKMLSKDEANEVIELISLHAYLYKESDVEVIYEKFKEQYELFKHLVELSVCDDLGRFCETMGQSVLDTQSILEKIKGKE